MFTKPTDMEVLKRFYRKARPMGLWRPVRDAVEAEDGDKVLPREPKHLIASGFATSFVGLIWIWLAVLCCSELLVGRYFAATWMGLSAAATGWIFKLMFDWYLERLTRNDNAHNELLMRSGDRKKEVMVDVKG